MSAATTVTETVAASSSAAAVGKCATAIGTADDRGDIAATSISISDPGPTGCRAGFGGFGGGFGRGGGTGSGTSGGAGTGTAANA